jgi:phosphinothricin acetyltransferase
MAAIYGESIASGSTTMDAGPCSADDMRRRLEGLGDREVALVVEAAGDVVGLGWVRAYSERRGYRFACETSIYVGQSAWGTGIADVLQRALLERARGFEYRHVVAKIVTANERSLRFHARHGFELVGVQRGIGMIGDRRHDVSILQLLLD